jgi:putative transcriptional regulator
MGENGLRNTIKVQRAMHDLTQADLASLAGVTRKSVNAIETGHMVPSVVLALRIAKALGVAVETVFSLEQGEMEKRNDSSGSSPG